MKASTILISLFLLFVPMRAFSQSPEPALTDTQKPDAAVAPDQADLSDSSQDKDLGSSYEKTSNDTPGLSEGGLTPESSDSSDSSDLGKSYKGSPSADPGLSQGSLPSK